MSGKLLSRRNLGIDLALEAATGGIPIRAGDELVGAIGVAGSPGAVHDEECAWAGIAKTTSDLG